MNKTSSVEIVFPVYSENINTVEDSTLKLLDHLAKIRGSFSFQVTISINGKKTRLLIEKVRKVCHENQNVNYCVTKEQGKGHAVISAWQNSSADILVYMDIDLATSLDSLEQLVSEIKKGEELCIGTRYLPDSTIKRSPKRYILSRLYHTILIQGFLHLPVSDVQCGYKAINKDVFLQLKPYLTAYNFFFDAELVFICHLFGKRILELPVTWTESSVSSVKLFRTSISFIIGAILLKVRYRNFKSA
jgi:glycosyltransferase involved in cell wall biosynthesis